MSFLLSDRWCRLKSRSEVLNFHSMICSVVMEGVSEIRVKFLVNTDSHHISACMLSFLSKSDKALIQVSVIKLPFPLWKLNFSACGFCPALLKKPGTTELKDELCSTWHKICRVKMNFVSTFVVPISVLKLFFNTCCFQLMLCMWTPDRHLLPAFSCLGEAIESFPLIQLAQQSKYLLIFKQKQISQRKRVGSRLCANRCFIFYWCVMLPPIRHL